MKHKIDTDSLKVSEVIKATVMKAVVENSEKTWAEIAAILGMSVRTFYRYLTRYKMETMHGSRRTDKSALILGKKKSKTFTLPS